MFYMRDSFFEQIYKKMQLNKKIFFLTADVGSPVLDLIKKDFSDRFINVGISEQNMINIASGLAIEGFEVYVYSIAAFFLRCLDQIRNSLLLTSQMYKMNVNLLATGKGVSYETAGPAHHCMEDLSVLGIFPGIRVYAPSDSIMAREMVDEFSTHEGIKYFCFEGKKSPNFYNANYNFTFPNGFIEYTKGEDICIISQGSILSLALEIAEKLESKGLKPGVIDLFSSYKSINTESFNSTIRKYNQLLVIEEGYREKGFLIDTVNKLTQNIRNNIKIHSFGFDDKYVFEVGPREMHYNNNGLNANNIIKSLANNKCVPNA